VICTQIFEDIRALTEQKGYTSVECRFIEHVPLEFWRYFQARQVIITQEGFLP